MKFDHLGPVVGTIVEDRGPIGVGGRRLYGIEFPVNPGQTSYIELPEAELELEQSG